MSTIDIVVIVVIAAIIGCAAFYIYKAKRSGQKCIGCPYSSECHGGSCHCGSSMPEEKNK